MPDMPDIYRMPRFTSNIPLGATDLNRMGSGEELLWGRHRRLVMPISLTEYGSTGNYMFHLYRYVRFRIILKNNTTSNRYYLNLNGITVCEVAQAASDGNWNLVFTIDTHSNAYKIFDRTGDVTPTVNPPQHAALNLAYDSVYSVKWTTQKSNEEFSAIPMQVIESSTADGTFPPPQFNGQPVSLPPNLTNASELGSDWLNRIAYYAEHLLYGDGYVPDYGCPSFISFIGTPNVEHYYRFIIPHFHPYLYFRAIVSRQGDRHEGTEDLVQEIEFEVHIHYGTYLENSVQLYSDDFRGGSGTGDGFWTEGNSIRHYHKHVDISTYSNAMGGGGAFYMVEFSLKKSLSDDHSEFHLWLLCESPDTSAPIV